MEKWKQGGKSNKQCCSLIRYLRVINSLLFKILEFCLKSMVFQYYVHLTLLWMDKNLSMIINMHSDISHKTTKYVLPWRLCRTTTKSFFANQIPEDTLCMPKARLIASYSGRPEQRVEISEVPFLLTLCNFMSKETIVHQFSHHCT